MTLRHTLTLAPRPSNVVRFEQLIYLALVVGEIQFLVRWYRRLASAPWHEAALTLSFNLLNCVADVLLIWLVARRGKNWSRWLMLVLYVLGIPFPLFVWLRFGLGWQHVNPVFKALFCLQWLAPVVAFYLIFTGNAREWFDRNRAANPQKFDVNLR